MYRRAVLTGLTIRTRDFDALEEILEILVRVYAARLVFVRQ